MRVRLRGGAAYVPWLRVETLQPAAGPRVRLSRRLWASYLSLGEPGQPIRSHNVRLAVIIAE